MDFKIAVCIKSVPDPKYYDKITIDAKTKRLTRKGIPSTIGKGDKVALEQALQFKEKYGGTVTVIAMAPNEALRELKEALAMGADKAVLLSDRLFGGADTLATAYTLSQGIRKIGKFDLILTGTESADGATAQVPAQLGECLQMGHLWNVKNFTVQSNQHELKANVLLDHAEGEYILRLPAVLGIARDTIKPRYITALGIKRSQEKPCVVISNKELKADEHKIGQIGSPTWPGDITIPSMKRAGKMLNGSMEQIVEELAVKFKSIGLKAVDRKVAK